MRSRSYSSTSSFARPKLPAAQLTVLSICRFAEPVALTGVFPYLPEMIESFGVPHAQVGQWAGILSAVFSVSQAVTAIPWGRASDRYGRKPVILTALTCAMLSSLLFGFSTSIELALVARMLSGASNGNVGILRTTVAEMVPQRVLQPKAFAILPLVWQVGSTVGPVLGGGLANPARKFPGLFGRNDFFLRFPYSLPNLVSGVIFIVGLLSGVLFLRESLEARKHKRDYGRLFGAWLCGRVRRERADSTPAYDFETALHEPSGGKTTHKPARYRDVLSKQACYTLLAYFFLGAHGVTFNQVLPVFLHLPANNKADPPFRFSGGFGYDSGKIGVIFTIFGIVSMLFQFTVFPWTAQRMGPLWCYRACTLAFPIIYLLTPFTVLMRTESLRYASVVGVLTVKSLADIFAYPCITIQLTNTARDISLLGTLNGIATSLSAIGRAIGPFVIGQAFTMSVEAGYIIIAWWLLALIAAAGHVVTWWLVESDEFGKEHAQHLEREEILEDIDLDTRVVAEQARAEAQRMVVDDSGSKTADHDSDSESELADNVPLLDTGSKKDS